MKLAQILATSPLPTGSPARLASPTVAPLAVGLTGLAEASASIAGTAERVGELQARADLAERRAEDAKRKHQDALDASRIANNTLDQLDVGESTLQMGTRDPVTDELIEAPVSSRDYMPAWLKLRDKLTQDALGRAPTAEAKLTVQKLLETPLRERQHGARKFSNALFVGQYTAGVEDEVQSLEKRAVLEPDVMTPDGTPLWETRITGVLASAQGVLGPEKVRARLQQSLERIDTATAKRRGLEDPEQTMADLEAGAYRIEQGRADALAKGIGDRWQTSVKQEEAAAKRRSEAWEKAWHGYQNEQYLNDYIATREGTTTLEGVKRNAREWHYTAAQTKELLDLIEKPQPEAKSDPGTRLRIMADVSGMTPTTTEREIKTLMANGLLSVEHGTEALRALTARRRQAEEDARQLAAQGRSAANEARTAVKYDQSEAESQLKAAMGIPDILPPGFSPEVAAAYSQAKQKLANVSAAFPSQGGKENPLTAVRKIIPEAQQAAGLYGRIKEQELIKLLPPELGKLAAHGPDGFLAAARALDAQRRTLGEPEFGRIAQVFAELRALYRDLGAANAITTPTPSTATPPGTFAVPKAPKGSR